MEVGGKDIRVLVNGAILYDVLAAFPDFENLSKARVQEIDLQIEQQNLEVEIYKIKERIKLFYFMAK